MKYTRPNDEYLTISLNHPQLSSQFHCQFIKYQQQWLLRDGVHCFTHPHPLHPWSLLWHVWKVLKHCHLHHLRHHHCPLAYHPVSLFNSKWVQIKLLKPLSPWLATIIFIVIIDSVITITITIITITIMIITITIRNITILVIIKSWSSPGGQEDSMETTVATG